jgi:hypothetical protein
MSEAFDLWRTTVGHPSPQRSINSEFYDFMEELEDAMWDAAADIDHPWAQVEEAWDRSDMREVRRIAARFALLGDSRVSLVRSTLTVSVIIPFPKGTVQIPIARYDPARKRRWVFFYWFEAMIMGWKKSA